MHVGQLHSGTGRIVVSDILGTVFHGGSTVKFNIGLNTLSV